MYDCPRAHLVGQDKGCFFAKTTFACEQSDLKSLRHILGMF